MVHADTTLLKPDFDELSFPGFGACSPNIGMAEATAAQLSARQTSTSPRGNQPSSLTFALRRTGSGESDAMNGHIASAPKPTAAPAATSEAPLDNAGSRPISVKGKTIDNRNMRRESIAQSLGMGMSWGGISVGSWVRDE